MATNEEIEAARARLEALRERARAMQGSLFDQPEKRSRGLVGGVVDSLAQGLTFGLADEIEAGIRAPFSEPPFEGATVGDRFNAIMFDLEQKRNAFRETNPKTSFAAEVGGGAAQGAGLLNLARSAAPRAAGAVTNLPFLPRLAAVGGAEGAAFGFGSANPGERGSGALQGLAFGSIGGPVLGSAAAITGKTLRPVVQKLVDSFTETPKAKAVNMVVKALQNDDITPDEASLILRRLGSQSTLADIGENLTDLTRTAQSIPGPAKQRGRLFLDDRQEGQRIRLVQAARNASGTNDLDRKVIDVINNAESQATDLYTQAYSQVLDVTPTMAELLKRPAMIKALNRAGPKLRNMGFSSDINQDVTDVRFMDTVKRALDDDIGVAMRQGRRDEVRILTNLKREFVNEIDAQVPVYAEARNVFAGEAAIRDAVEVGRNALKPNTSSSMLAEAVQGMTESEIQGARQGLMTAITDQLDSLQNVTGAANRFSRIPKLRAALQTVFPDAQALEDFLQTAASESRFAQTRNTVIGGSPTARIQAGQRSAAADTNPFNIAFDAFTGGQSTMLQGVKNAVFRDDIEPEVAEELIKILLNPNVIPQSIQPPLAQRAGDFIVPRTNPRTTFPGLIGGGLGGTLIDNNEPQSILDMLIQNPGSKLGPQQ